MVGSPALVGLLPLVAQGAQHFLHLSAAEGLAFGTLEQVVGLGHQVFADLVGAPALPAFEFTGRHQGRMHAGFQRRLNQLAMLLEHRTQGGGSAAAGLGVAFGGFLFEFDQRSLNRFLRSSTQRRVDRGWRRLGRLGRPGWLGSGFGRLAASGTQLVGPYRHRRQCGRGIAGGRSSLRQSRMEGFGDT